MKHRGKYSRKSILILLFTLSFFCFSELAAQVPSYEYKKPELSVYVHENNEKLKAFMDKNLEPLLSDVFQATILEELPEEFDEVYTALISFQSIEYTSTLWSGNPKYSMNAALSLYIPDSGKQSGPDYYLSVSADGSDKDKDRAFYVAAENLARKIASQCKAAYTKNAIILDIEGTHVYIDHGEEAGLKKGVYCDVMNEDGKNIGVVKILGSYADGTKAEIIKGQNRIEKGHSVTSRFYFQKTGWGIDALFVPVSGSEGELYQQATNDRIKDLSSAKIVMIKMVREFSRHGGQASIGGGYYYINEDINSFIFDASVSPAYTLVFDAVSVFFELGGGCLFLPSQPWARPAGNYNDNYDDSGETELNCQWFLRAEPGLRFSLNKKLSLTVSAGYFYSGKGDDWRWNTGTSENPSYVDVPTEFLRNSNVEVSGIHFGVSFSWMLF